MKSDLAVTPRNSSRTIEKSGDAVSFVPLKRSVRLADQLYEQIVNLIVKGGMPRGERLPTESQLCEIFGVSRPVVREAICRLQADGLVITRQGAGTYVEKRPKNEFLNLAPIGGYADLMRCFEFRIALEGEAAFLAAQRRTRSDLAEIDSALIALDRAVHSGEIGAQADHRFHLAIARASQNDMLYLSLEALSENIFTGMTVGRSLSLHHSPERLATVQREHETIGAAVRVGDAEAARDSIRMHVENARARVLGDTSKG
jgi:GntR family transcriptional repressor for pyruvate dehydrogenase complex